MTDKINYVVACYLGPRRSTGPAGEVFIKRHLEYLEENNVPLSRVSVVLSADNSEQVVRAQPSMKKVKDYYTDIKLFIRHNVSYSYGAWSDTINSSIQNGEDIDYFFLIEDDYLPARPDFLDILMSRLDEETAFVCQKVFEQPSVGGVSTHAAVSNGMLSGRLAKNVYEQFESVFEIVPAYNYPQAERNQVNFLNNISSAGYKFTDVSDECSVHFLEHKVGGDPIIKIIDEDSGPPLLLPITE